MQTSRHLRTLAYTYTSAHIPALIYSHIHKNINMRAYIKHAYIQTHKFVHTHTHTHKHIYIYINLIGNFRHVLNVVCFLLFNFMASEFYVLKFRNTLLVPSS